jgi:hypothetical protein
LTTEAELQAVLNTLTEHDFYDAFKKITEVLGKVLFTIMHHIMKTWAVEV